MHFEEKKQPLWLRFIKIAQYPLLIGVAAAGIVAYNGWHTMKIEPLLQYREFKYYESAERYLRENYNLNTDAIKSWIGKSKGNYIFFQAGLMFQNVAPFQMAFLYENGFPVEKENILWHPIDDRYSLDLELAEVYQENNTMFLRLKGTLVFTPRPFIDMLKTQRLLSEGFTEKDGRYVKAIEHNLKLNANLR